MAVDGFVGADYVISQLGKSYEQMDCVRLAVVNVIKNCPGGDKSYRTAGCTELWNSLNKSGKYHHIVECRTLAEAKRDGMKVGDLPVIYNAASQVCEHIAYYLGGYKGYECIHSSASKGKVCETFLKNGFTHVLRHRDIIGRDVADIGSTQNGNAAPQKGSEIIPMNVIYTATVTTNGGALNLRSAPSTGFGCKVLTEIPYGAEIGVVRNVNDDWAEVVYNNITGYVSRKYITVTSAQTQVDDPHIAADSDGMVGTYTGQWGVFLPCSNKEEADRLIALFHLSHATTAEPID